MSTDAHRPMITLSPQWSMLERHTQTMEIMEFLNQEFVDRPRGTWGIALSHPLLVTD